MVRWIMLGFAGLTLLAATLTYNNVGLQKVKYEEPSIRSGSRGYNSNGYIGGYSSGGFRGGK